MKIPNVAVIDSKIHVNYRGGTSATIMPHEYKRIRPDEKIPRRVDYVFRHNVIVEMPLDFAKFIIAKYPNRFKTVNESLDDIDVIDELDDMGYEDMKKVLSELNKEAKEIGIDTRSILVKKDVLRESIREIREELSKAKSLLPNTDNGNGKEQDGNDDTGGHKK